MPEMDGFEALRALGTGRTPRIIFVTAYDQYALRAFEVHALDYLLKPFVRSRFRQALNRAVEIIRAGQLDQAFDERLAALLREPPERKLDPRRFLRVHRSILVSVDAIQEFRPWFYGQSVLLPRNGGKITVGHAYRQKLETILWSRSCFRLLIRLFPF